MKKVVFLGDTLLNNEPLGIQRFAYEILLELDCILPMYEMELLIPEKVECKILLKNIKIVRYGSYRNPFLWRQIYFPYYIKKQKALSVDLTLGLCVFANGVTGIFDCIYENFPDDFRSIKEKIKRKSYLIRAKYVIKHAKKIVTISEYSKKDIQTFYKIENSKLELIYCGWQHYEHIKPDNTILNRLCLERNNYIFSLGSSLPHKNFNWIIRAAKNNPQYQFVVTGTNRLSRYIDSLETDNLSNILFTGFLKDDEVKALMENSLLFVHPSLYEGFGIPPLEALSCGAKVATSDKTCLPEIFSDTVAYFDANCLIPEISSILREETISRQYVLDKYSWKKSAKAVAKMLNSLIEE